MPQLPTNQEPTPPPVETSRVEQDLVIDKDNIKLLLDLDKDDLIKKLYAGKVKVAPGELKSLEVAEILLQQKHLKQWLENISQDASSYKQIPEDIKANPDFIELAFQKNPEILEYLTTEQQESIKHLLSE